MPHSVEPAARINLRWIVRLRWGAIAGQLIAILVAKRVLQEPLPLGTLLAVVGTLALANVGMQFWLARGARPSDSAIALNLLADVVALTALLALTGGPANPFSALYLVHITIAAIVLPQRWSWLLAAASVGAYTLLHVVPGDERYRIGEDTFLRLHGRWFAFVVAAAFISTFSLRMSAALRRRDQELDRARSDAEAAERLGALGTLAAGTAHELNTPLGTIAVLAGELAAQTEGAQRADVEEIRRQVKRCKEIISNMLAPRGGDEEPKEFEVAPVVEAAVRRWQEGRPGPRPALSIDEGVQRARARLPLRAFEQAILNLLDNAAEATEGRSARQLRVSLGRGRRGLQLTVEDNGVGVPEPLLRRLGEPFFTTKEPGQGSGLGLFLARTVVEREGGEMEVLSGEGRGTRVTLLMPEAGA